MQKSLTFIAVTSLFLAACGGGGGAPESDGGGGGPVDVTPNPTPTPVKTQNISVQFDADYIGSFREPEMVVGEAVNVIDQTNGIPIPPEFYDGTPLHITASTSPRKSKGTIGSGIIRVQPHTFIGITHRVSELIGIAGHRVALTTPHLFDGSVTPRQTDLAVGGNRWTRIYNKTDKVVDFALQLTGTREAEALTTELIVVNNGDIPEAYGATRGDTWYSYETEVNNSFCSCDISTLQLRSWDDEPPAEDGSAATKSAKSSQSSKSATSDKLEPSYPFVMTFKSSFNSPFGRGPHKVEVITGIDGNGEFTQEQDGLSIQMPAELSQALAAKADQAPNLIQTWLENREGVYGAAELMEIQVEAISETAPDRNTTTNRHIDDINAVSLYENTNNGQGVTVCITDLGFSAGGEDVPFPVAEQSADGSGSAQAEGELHGTAVTSLITASPENGGLVGLAHNANILMSNIFSGGSAGGFSDDVIEGMEFCINNNASIINGSYGFFGSITPQGKIFGVSEIVDGFIEDGGFLVFSAGNDGKEYTHLEAKNTQGYIRVAGNEYDTDIQYNRTNTGGAIDIAAPAWMVHTISDDSGASPVFKTQSGTSFAAPIVSGVLATIIGENANFDSYWFDRLIGTGVGVQHQHLIGDFGAGVIEADGLLEAAKTLPSSVGKLFANKYSFRPAYDGQETAFILKSNGENVLASEITAPAIAGLDIAMVDDVANGEVVVTMTATNRDQIAAVLGNHAEITFTRNGDNMPFVLAGMQSKHSLTESHKGSYWVGVTRGSGSVFKVDIDDPAYNGDKSAFSLDAGYRNGVSPDDVTAAELCFSPSFRPSDALKTCVDITDAYTADSWGDIPSDDAAVNVTVVLRAN
jgi:hypothetical protein